MDKGPEVPTRYALFQGFLRVGLALTRRKIRVLNAGDVTAYGPVLYAVGHPADFLAALVMSLAIERPVRCLLPEQLLRGPFRRWLAGRLDMILLEGEKPSESNLQEAVDFLVTGGALVVFADQNAVKVGAPHTVGFAGARLVQRAESQHPASVVAVYPVHLYLPESAAQSREVLVHVDTALSRAEGWSEARASDGETPAWAAELDASLRQNAFQIPPRDVEFFLGDLEEVLRTGLQEEWASLPDWKQDTEGFGLSRFAIEWVKQANDLTPGRLVALRDSVEKYRSLQRQCARREIEVDGGELELGPAWRRALLWIETLLGLPIALYGVLNHLLVGLALFLAGSFKQGSTRPRKTEWIIRSGVILVFYVLQIYLVAHAWGRAAAGYYAPSVPASGAYLWRYVGLVRPQARLLFISLTIPALKKKIKRLRQAIVEKLDQTLSPVLPM